MRIGIILKKWRNTTDFSLREVADQIGIHHSTLARIEAGKIPPADSLVKILFWIVGEENGSKNGVAVDRPRPASSESESGVAADARTGD